MSTGEVNYDRFHESRAASLMRKLVAVAEGVVITLHDCWTSRGVVKTAEGDRGLAGTIRARVSRQTITTNTGQVMVREDELITGEQARAIEKLDLDRVVVRSPMNCAAPRGVCRLCYGMDPSTGGLVEKGMAVGHLAARK